MMSLLTVSVDAEPALKLIESILKHSSKIYEAIRSSYKVYPPELVIHCPENIQKLSLAFEAKAGIIPNKIKFPYGEPGRVKVRSLSGMVDLSDSIRLTENGFELSTKSMSSGDIYLLDVEYEIKSRDPNYLNSLVQRDHAKEVPNEDNNEYWMHAELKHPNVLKTKYGKLELRDIDFNIDVGISEDVNTVIPETFKKELRIGMNMLKENNPHTIQKLGYERIKTMKSRGKNKAAVDSLSDLQEFFFPSKFCQYITVERDFRYSECFRGSKYDDNLPWNLTWPKTMKIVSRTDLNLDNCAAEGTVKYKKRSFIEEITKIIGKK